ncbi:MAG: lysylphosphatidylglycerol synthase domain-containing protein [Steroidobacteraceae bacterium]|nr:lysylphosphatidylglycerol synthase domain-containing protein [Steroidobacteraceae bacterium]
MSASAPGGRARLLKLAPWGLAILVLALVGRQAMTLDWAEVWAALRAQSTATLGLALLLAALSHGLYASFDLVSRRMLRHGLTAWRTAVTAATSYAFNLNFGALLGGMALRLRMYTRQGVDAAIAGQVIAWSLVTNWLGYFLVGGIVLGLAPPPVPEEWPLTRDALRVAGLAIGALGVAYLVACGVSRRRELRWREHRLALPRARIALLQAALSSANWLLIGTLVWMLLGRRVEFATTVAVLQLAAVAGVVTHVPAGLGVLEAVFLATLGSRLPQTQLLAALLAYRATYYLAPLAWAVPAYFLGEGRGRALVQVPLRTCGRSSSRP